MNIASLLQGLATIAWIGFLGVVGTTIIRAGRGQPGRGMNSLIAVLLVVALLMTTLGAGLVFLQADQYGIVISAFQANGYRSQPLGPGLHLILPFLESVRTYSVARQTYTMSVATGEG